MYLADPAHSSFNAAENILGRDNAGVLEAAWTLGVPGRLAAAATVVDGVLYFGDWGGQFHAVDAETGRTLWTQFVGMAAPPEDPGCQPAIGVTAQAAVAGNTVYVGGGDSAVYALDRATGRVEWRTALADPRTGSYLWSSITPYAGALYIGVASLGDCPLVRGALVRIDLARPDRPLIRYLYPEDEQGGGIWSTPAIDEASGTVYVTTGTGEQDVAEGRWGGTFAALDANTLEMRAHYLLPSNSLEGDIEWGSSPTLFTLPDGTRLVAATGKDGVLYALRAGDLAVAWTSTIAVSCICPECGCGSLSTPAWDGADALCRGRQQRSGIVQRRHRVCHRSGERTGALETRDRGRGDRAGHGGQWPGLRGHLRRAAGVRFRHRRAPVGRWRARGHVQPAGRGRRNGLLHVLRR